MPLLFVVVVMLLALEEAPPSMPALLLVPLLVPRGFVLLWPPLELTTASAPPSPKVPVALVLQAVPSAAVAPTLMKSAALKDVWRMESSAVTGSAVTLTPRRATHKRRRGVST